MPRRPQPEYPNVLITGTPATGKTSLCARICRPADAAAATPSDSDGGDVDVLPPPRHIDVSAFAKENECLGEWDAKYSTYELDEDKLLDLLEPIMIAGNVVLDYHSSDFFPERWIQLVVILRCSSETLFDRSTARGYAGEKLSSNLASELMNVSRDEALAAYPSATHLELASDRADHADANARAVEGALREERRRWARRRGAGGEENPEK